MRVLATAVGRSEGRRDASGDGLRGSGRRAESPKGEGDEREREDKAKRRARERQGGNEDDIDAGSEMIGCHVRELNFTPHASTFVFCICAVARLRYGFAERLAYHSTSAEARVYV